MENEIIKIAATQGMWAVLSIVLIFYILKAQEKRDIKQDSREQNYQNVISQLTETLNIEIRSIKDDIASIKGEHDKINSNYKIL